MWDVLPSWPCDLIQWIINIILISKKELSKDHYTIAYLDFQGSVLGGPVDAVVNFFKYDADFYGKIVKKKKKKKKKKKEIQ